MQKVNLEEMFSKFSDQWSPKIVAELNGQQVKLAKLQGEFIWHSHEAEDEMFLVVRGKLKLLFRDGEVELNEGEMLVVPKGVEHKPVAEEEVMVMLFEPASTINTGEVINEKTKTELERL